MRHKTITAKTARNLAFALVLGCASLGQAQQGPQPLSALQSLQPGLWEFKSDDVRANRTLCLTEMQPLLQLSHFGQSCSRFIITNESRIATVHYACQNSGNGQTTVRVETPRLVQLQTQGLYNRAPFSYSAEGRRIANCGGRISMHGR